MILAGRARQAGDRAGCRVRARRGQASVRSRSESIRPRGQLPDGQKKSGFSSGGGLTWAQLGWERGWHVPGQGTAERGLCGARGRLGTGQGPRGPDPRRGAPTTPIPMSLLKKKMVLSENLVMNVCFFPNFCFPTCCKSQAGQLGALPCQRSLLGLKKKWPGHHCPSAHRWGTTPRYWPRPAVSTWGDD